MKKDITIPQGKFKIGRDIHEGVYLIAALNDMSWVTIYGPGGLNDKYEHYTLDDENNSKLVHIEVEKGDVLVIDGRVKMRHITKFIEGDNCNLLDEISNFEKDLGFNNVEKNTNAVEEENEGEEDFEYDDDVESSSETPKKSKLGFWGALGALLSSTSGESDSSGSSSARSSSPKKRDTGRCDGDCDNCPAHYGYRYGRWYYGHGHQHGCQRGGNGGASGKCYKD